ncbi:MAG TPA: hypothetical protein PKE64_14315 [Anaerolineae bacterium]|nr:hypothetical protein [Anaerolineae bacterium]HMR65177.1 hypothetical protein [Anaerolineae bacterium]
MKMKTVEEFFVLICRRKEQAEEAFNRLQRLERKNFVRFKNLALLQKDESGQTTFSEMEELSPWRTTVLGGLLGSGLGGIEGLTFGGVGLAVGAVLGFLVATWRDRGFNNADLQTLSNLLAPNSAVIIGQVKSHGVDMLWINLIDHYGLLIRPLTYLDLASVIKRSISLTQSG